MSFIYAVNNAPATGAVAMFNLKELMKAAGWVVRGSGDATSFSSSADILTTGASGTNGLGNTSSWFRIQCPLMGGVQRELTIQRGTTDLLWRIKYSYSTAFTGGTTSATRTPSATDEQVLHGSGTDAAPVGATLFGANAGYKHQIGCADGYDGMMFYSIAYGHNAGAVSHAFFFDQLQTDSINAADVDGYMFYLNTSIGGTGSSLNGHAAGGPKGWLRKGMTGESFVNIPVCIFQEYNSSGTIASSEQGIGLNAFDSRDTGLPAIYARLASEPNTYSGIKGVGKLFKIAGSNRGTGTPLTLTTTRDRIQIDKLILPWNGSFPLL